MCSEKPTLVGESVVLRPFSEADLDAMGHVLSDPDVLRLTGSVNTTNAAESESSTLDDATREWYLSRHEQPDRLDLAVVDNASGECVGEVVLNELEPENESCNFRTLIGPSGRDRGLGSESARLLLEHAFRSTSLYRIGLEVYSFNSRAQHVYERVGFVAEGRRRGALLFDGERVDAIVMSLLRPEWLARHS